MGANLIEQLRQVEDFRTLDGRRHPLWLSKKTCKLIISSGNDYAMVAPRTAAGIADGCLL